MTHSGKISDRPTLLHLATCCSLAFLTAGCTASAWSEKIQIESTPMPTQCAGWSKIDVKQRMSLFLMREDPKLLMEIDSHNLKGRNLGCWQ